MADEPQETTGLQCAIRRLSSLLERTRSSKRNSTCHLPSKDATPSRSALKGGRWPGLPEERRVSFHDSLPCLRLGPPFEYQPSSDAEQHDRRTGLLLPAITADDRDTDDCFRQVDYSPKRVDSSLDDSVVPKPVSKRNGVAGPAILHRTTTVRFPAAGFEGIPNRAERRRSCLDFTSTTMEERSRSQSRMRPRPLFAERQLWTVRRGPPSRCAWIVLLHKQPILPTPIWDDMKESRTMMARTISPARIEHTSTAQSSRCKDKPNATAGIWSTPLSKCKELWTRP
jgi:hypothetical protein